MHLTNNEKKKVLVFAATYNESGNINELINAIFNQNNEVHALFIDDNSPDKTSDIINELKKNLKISI